MYVFRRPYDYSARRNLRRGMIWSVPAKTYYMRADGTATNKTAAVGPGNTIANCMNMTVHNASAFNPGDTIILCDDGGEYRLPLYVPSSGTDHASITYQAESGDTPIINASKEYDSWSTEDEAVLDEASSVTQILAFNSANRTYVGQGDWTADDDYTISAVEVQFHSVTGSGPGDIVAEIYTIDGSHLNTKVGSTSDALTVDSGGTYKFTGLGASITNGTDYSIVLRRSDSSYDSSNAAFLHLTSSGVYGGQFQTWNDSETNTGKWASNDTGLKLFQIIGNLYYADYTGDPNQVFWDDDLLTENTTSKVSLATGEWWNDETNDRIYLYDDPTSAKVEGSYYSLCIRTDNNSYLVFDGLTLDKSGGHNFWLNIAAGRFDEVTIQNCNIRKALNHGIGAGLGGFSTSGSGVSSGLYILNNTLSDNGVGAIALGTGTGFTINISGNSPTDYIEDVVVSGNLITSGAAGIKGDWFSNDIVIKYNYISVTSTGLSSDGGRDISYIYNIIDTLDSSDGYAVSIFRWEGAPGPPYGFALSGFKVYGNVFYGGQNGISLSDDQTNTKIKNNIFHGNFSSNTPVWMEGGKTRTGLDIDYNLYYTGAHTPLFTISGVDTYNFSEWQAEGYDTNSPDMADPTFNAPGSDDFTLQSGSPAIGVGENLGGAYADALDPTTSWPSGVVTLDLDVYGWGAGAYAFVSVAFRPKFSPLYGPFSGPFGGPL